MPPKQHALRVNGKRRLGALLGRGSSKSVHLFLDKRVAVAVCTPRHGACFQHEVSILELVQGCAHLLQMIRGDRTELVLELAPFGSVVDLADTLEFAGDDGLTLAHVECAAAQVETALQTLAALGWEHGDLRAQNVLVFAFHLKVPSLMHVKLGDFGSSCKYTHGESLTALRRELHNLCPHNQVSPPP